MKMVKSLLLGSAAGLVAVAGAQAADLPVKAKPVEYVKVCSIYGAGFFYIPGTDTCIKIGGYLRMDVGIYASGSHSPYLAGGQARHDRQDTDVFTTRVRGVVSTDVRTETEYGTLRSYIRAGWQFTSGSTSLPSNTATGNGQVTAPYFDRGFIQFAGFTIGRTQSFWDFFNATFSYYYGSFVASDTGGGVNVIAYTAQFGGGFSATIAVEDPSQRRASGGIFDTTSLGSLPIGGNSGQAADYRGYVWPDVQGILRVDQPWGSAQLAGLVRDVSAGYYFPNFQNFPQNNPHGSQWPDNKVGWAVEGGISINLPWAAGDKFVAEAAYGKGALNYISNVTNVGWFRPENCGIGAAVGCASLAWGTDAVFAGAPSLGLAGSSLELTTAWSVKAGIEHYWTPALRTTLFGGYEQVRYTDVAANQLCTVFLNQNGGAAPGAVCDPDHNIWQVGSRTIWNPVRNLDIGVEVVYMKLDQKHAGNFALVPGGAKAPLLYTMEDADIWTGTVRFQRNFWP